MDLTVEQLVDIVDYACSLYPDERMSVDWEDFLFRVEKLYSVELPESMEDPLIRKIQRLVRAGRAEMFE